MSAVLQVREEFREPVRRALRWLLSLRDGEGRIVCPEHRIEHTGKSAGAAVSSAILGLLEQDEELIAAARQQGWRMVKNLVREGTSPCHTFRPGRHDPFNCSNSVIDGGACSDALAELALRLDARLSPDERRAFREASLLHARTYLRYAVLDKGIPAQRAWGLTGLAGAWVLEPDPDLERAALEAVGQLEGIQLRDGAYPYHPLEWGAEHRGASDVSSFYQSRVTAFVLFALERLGRDPKDGLFAPPILRGLDFLLALQGPNGHKCGLVEAKPWYWGADYEVASNVFDVYALARGAALFDRPDLAAGALSAFRAWAAHLRPSGEPQSHFAGTVRSKSYQCPLFWAAHAEWIARALPDLERAAQRRRAPAVTGGAGIDLAVKHYREAQLVRLEDDAIVAWIRGSRPGFNLHHGSPHGGGLLQVVRKSDGRALLERSRFGARQESEWSGSQGGPALLRAWRANGSELRFSFWLLRNHWRGRRHLAALGAPWHTFKRGILAFAAPTVSSAFVRAVTLGSSGDAAFVTGGLAWRDGTPVPGAKIERRYEIDGRGLVVREQLIDDGGSRARYSVPRSASELRSSGSEVSYRLA